MRVIPPPSSPSMVGGDGRGYLRDNDAESLFRSKPVAEIRNVEAATRKQIQDKSEELRQLVGNRYRDLIDSADSIVLMKSLCESISSNISVIHTGILNSLSSTAAVTPSNSPNPNRARIYGIACRVKYLVDTPENIWGCLDETMFLEAAARYMRAKQVYHGLNHNEDNNYKNVLSKFPLLQHQWQIIESFKVQISQRSRERLLEHALDLEIGAYADALAAIAVIDELDPNQVLNLFLDSRKSYILQKLSGCSSSTATSSDVISVFCEVLKIIQVTVSQVGELYLQVLSDMPLFYKIILSSPPTSQLFGGIPNPDEEVRSWKIFRDKLESVMVSLDRDYIAKTCSHWLKNCGKEIVNKIKGRYLIDAIDNGQGLAEAEKLIRETMEGKHVLEGSIDWLKRVFGSEIELPWKRTRELVLGDDSDLWDEIFEDAFAQRMKAIIDSGFNKLNEAVNVSESVHAILGVSGDFQAYMNRSPMGGGVWFLDPDSKKSGLASGIKNQLEETDFHGCLGAYFGTEVSRIRDAVDDCCKNVLEDLLYFLESPKASSRLRILAPYLQNMCYTSISTIMTALKNELENLYSLLENKNKESEAVPQPSVIVERSLFIGKLLIAFQKHLVHVPVILGSPRLWVNESTARNSKSVSRYSRTAVDSSLLDSRKKIIDSTKRQSSMATSALFGLEDSSSPQLDELGKTTQDLCIRAHNLWITWVSDELSTILLHNLKQDDSLSATSSLRGWEETVVKQERSGENESEMKISLPSMPSLYITSFLFQSCEEIDRIGGHVLDRIILQNFASRLLEKVMSIYGYFASAEEVNVSEKGVLQVLLDIKFASDVLSGGDLSGNDQVSKVPKSKIQSRRKQGITKSVIRESLDGLLNQYSQRLDPIDWLTYEPFLWENERQSYLRHAVLFGFFVQLNRMYTDTVQKLPTNSESNIMRCSTVPRFKYLPISAPALSAKSGTTASMSTSMDDVSSRSSWKSLTNQELSRTIDIDENSSFGVATPFLKSFMQVGSKFGESTLKFGSMLTDGQVGRFGDILPAQAAGLLSSFTATRSDS